MTTKDFIKKTQQILSKKLTVTQITFQQQFNINNELKEKVKVEEQMYVTVFYKKKNGEETNFTVNSYDWSDHYGIEELLVKVKEHLAGMEEIKSHTTGPEIESVKCIAECQNL